MIQPKLTINQPNDWYEQEADRVADQVMRMPEPRLQRQVELEEEEEETLQAKPLAAQITPLVQRQVEPEEEEEEELLQAKRPVQRQIDSDSATHAEAPPVVHDVLRSPGQPLEPVPRGLMETRLGHDFSRVRVHTDPRANKSAQAVNALAFTVGADVLFDAGQYQPQAKEGKRLLAHELAHVLQQKGQPPSSQARLRISEPSDGFEREAERVSDEVMDESPGFYLGIEGPGLDDASEEEKLFTQRVRREQPSGSGYTSATPVQYSTFSASATPVLQRAASFVPGRVNRQENLAVNLVAGGGGGYTQPALNSTLIFRAADAIRAINGPTLAQYPLDGLVECWVHSVPTNTGSFEMFLPTGGPWTTVTRRRNVFRRGLVPLRQCNAAGNTTFSANGQPSDGHLARDIESHERNHASNHETIFNAILGSWDARLTAAQTNNTRFSDANFTACEAALYAAMGGTPGSIATTLRSEWLRARDRLHADPAGRDITWSNPRANASCSTSSVDLRI